MRRILHADMDAFYAAIEELDHPDWKDVPLVVGADPRKGSGRGVVSTCNYAARRFGIRSAMAIRRAYELCPNAIFVPPRMERYMEISERIMEIFHHYSPLVEPLSLDEAFLDCSGTDRLFGDAATLGRSLKDSVRSETGLIVSIGISAVKFIAKIASDLEKPDGLVVVQPGQEAAFLAPLPVERLWGAGPETCKKLREHGISTIGELGRRELKDLPGGGQGKLWKHLHNLSRALDDREVVSSRQRKSIGEERTFGTDISDSDRLRQRIMDLCSELAYRIRKSSFQGRTITVKYRFTGFETHTRSRTEAEVIVTEGQLRRLALDLWEEIEERRGDRSIRLLGVQVSHAIREDQQQDLFGSGSGFSSAKSDGIISLEKEKKIDSAMDQINERFGKKLKRGLSHN
ncbi:MAG: DNA polymerase IV [Leptospiraceae bacterium]|nr:DNA polymerase IV [Leptospiraceae bacterium]